MVQNRVKKGQSFSMDILVVVAIVLFGVIFLVATKLNDPEDQTRKLEDLQEKASEQSRVIVDELKENEIIDTENNVEVESLLQVDVQELKEDLNIEGDFCIVFEKDGKLVKIDPENNVNGIGSDKIIVNDVPCKSS